MARVITFSIIFPEYHPRAGQPTDFVEKFHWWFWGTDHKFNSASDMLFELNDHLPQELIENFIDSLDDDTNFQGIEKGHTIRAGNRFKAGDWFSPRVWGNDINPKSGRSGPYHSKQIVIAPDIQVKKTWDFEVYHRHNGKADLTFRFDNIPLVAKNDGLELVDFLHWFNKPMTGQIICWNDKIEY